MNIFKKRRISKQIESAADLGEIAKILSENKIISAPNDNNHNTFGEPLDQLNPSGELPWGWIAHNKSFVDKIENEYSYFLNQWINARNKNNHLKEYSTLKSLIQYINDAKNLCEQKGDCFFKWFTDCVADETYLAKRESELKDIEESINDLLAKDKIKKELLPNLHSKLLSIIENSPGIIQTDIYKMFPKEIREDIASELYYLSSEGTIIRKSNGRTYLLFIK